MLWHWIVLGLICTFRWNRRRRCNSSPCSWVRSSCSRSCGGGRQSPRITRQKGACGSCNLPPSRRCNTQCCPVNCRWASWGSWSSCSVTCGWGLLRRSRWYAVSQQCGGSYCSGVVRDSKSCYAGCCPVNCQWSSWGAYGPCSTTCGSGTQLRTRQVAVAPSCNGAACSGGNADIAQCQINPICRNSHRRNKPTLNEQIEISSDVKSAKPQPKTTEENNQFVDFKNSGNNIDKYHSVKNVADC